MYDGHHSPFDAESKKLFLFFYIIVHGMAQHNGKQTGTTAAPDLLDFFDLLSASYSYLPLPFA